MHFDTTLTFSREAVQLYRQNGKRAGGNPSPGIPWTRWTIKTITPPTSNKKTLGFHCSIINQIGLAPTEQNQLLTNNPGETPPPTSLENVSFMKRMTISEATKRLRITSTVNDQTITYAKLADETDQTRDNTRDQQGDISTEQKLIHNEITNICYHSQQVGKQEQGKQGTPFIILCDKWSPSLYHAQNHVKKVHGLNRPGPPRALPSDHKDKVCLLYTSDAADE